jgi:hypothetical protein
MATGEVPAQVLWGFDVIADKVQNCSGDDAICKDI